MTFSEFSKFDESWPNPIVVDNRSNPWCNGKKNCPLSVLSIGWYLFRVMNGNRNIPRVSNENTLCITTTGNVVVNRWVIPLVTIPLLDFVAMHWIQRKSFRENSIKYSSKWKVIGVVTLHTLRRPIRHLHWRPYGTSIKIWILVYQYHLHIS